MSTLLHTDQAQAFTGLGTWTCTVPSDGQYVLDCQAHLPPASGLQIQLTQTGSATVTKTTGGTSQNPSATQSTLGNRWRFTCAAGDVLSAVLTSSAAVDSQPNSVKGTINLYLNYGE